MRICDTRETGTSPQASRQRRKRNGTRWRLGMQDTDGRSVGEAGGEPIMTRA